MLFYFVIRALTFDSCVTKKYLRLQQHCWGGFESCCCIAKFSDSGGCWNFFLTFADDTGTTRRRQATVLTWSKWLQISGLIPGRLVTLLELDWKLYFILKIGSWTLRMSGLILGYCSMTLCICPVKRTCSKRLNLSGSCWKHAPY